MSGVSAQAEVGTGGRQEGLGKYLRILAQITQLLVGVEQSVGRAASKNKVGLCDNKEIL